jgi:hypothetical protein
MMFNDTPKQYMYGSTQPIHVDRLSASCWVVLAITVCSALLSPVVAAWPCTLFFDSGYHDNQGKFHPQTHKAGTCNMPQAPSQLFQLWALYVTFPSPSQGITAMQRMALHGIIETWTQPFTNLDMPETFRIDFDHEEWTTSAMMLYLDANFSQATYEQIPQFGGNAVNPALQSNDPKRGEQRYLDYVGLDQAKQYCGTAKKKIRVAIIDNAFQATHPDLGWGVVNTIDVTKWGSNVSPIDKGPGREHGTTVHGLLAAASNNQVGIESVSDNATDITLIKAGADELPGSTISHGLEAIAAAVKEEVDIISISRGAFGANTPMFQKVIDKALAKNVTIIAAAGNYNSQELFYPAAFEQVVAVWSVGKTGKKSWFSNYGDRVDLAGPGEEMLTTTLWNSYTYIDGTSHATPLVAGVIAFARAHDISLEKVLQVLKPTTEKGIGKGIISMANFCGKATCSPSYPQFDYNGNGSLDPTDIDIVKNQYLGIQKMSTCTWKQYPGVCCPAGKICDLDANNEVNAADASIRWLVQVGNISFDLIGDKIDNNCDGVTK